MKRPFSFVAASALLWGPAPTAGAEPATGSISGKILLETGSSAGLPMLPVGLVVTIRVLCYGPASPHQDAVHPTVCGVASVPIATQDHGGQPFTVTNLPLAPTALSIAAEVASVNDGPHHWSAGLRTTVPPGFSGSLDPLHPNLDRVTVSAHGLEVPATATADGVVPTGVLSVTIELRRSTPAGDLPRRLPSGLRLVIANAANPRAPPIVSAAVVGGTADEIGGGATFSVRVPNLPIGKDVSARLVGAGPTPLPLYFVALDPEGRRWPACVVKLAKYARCRFIGRPLRDDPPATPSS